MFAQKAFGYQVRASGGEPTVALLAQPRAVATGQKPHARTRQLELARRIMREDREILRALCKL
jgi:hypothetical protein